MARPDGGAEGAAAGPARWHRAAAGGGSHLAVGLARAPWDSARCWCHPSAFVRGRTESRRCFDQRRWRHPTALKRVRAELDPLDLSPPRSDDE